MLTTEITGLICRDAESKNAKYCDGVSPAQEPNFVQDNRSRYFWVVVAVIGVLGILKSKGGSIEKPLPMLVEDTSDSDDWVTLLNRVPDVKIYCPGVEYAVCWTAKCTKNGDGKTASCGCLSVRDSIKNEGRFEPGWSSSVLIGSHSYRAVLKKLINNETDDAETEFCDLVANKTLYDDYGLTPDRISVFGTYNEYINTTSNDRVGCDNDVSYAQCMGAPCYNSVYNGIWNLTCICPYVNKTSGSTWDSGDDVCWSANATGDCAVVAGSSRDTYTLDYLESTVSAMKSANMTVRNHKCPCVGS